MCIISVNPPIQTLAIIICNFKFSFFLRAVSFYATDKITLTAVYSFPYYWVVSCTRKNWKITKKDKLLIHQLLMNKRSISCKVYFYFLTSWSDKKSLVHSHVCKKDSKMLQWSSQRLVFSRHRLFPSHHR